MAPFAAALMAALFAANSTGPLPTGPPPAPLARRPLATVVVLTCNRQRYAQLAVREIKRQDYRPLEVLEYCKQGKLPYEADMEAKMEKGEEIDPDLMIDARPLLMGQAAGAVTDIQPARVIVESMVSEAIGILQTSSRMVARL